MSAKPLSGIRVLDFTAFPPGGLCTVTLADVGAEVIRIESPAQKGQPSLVVRQVAMSRGKKSLTLDMRNPEANAVFARLVAAADVVVENAKPGTMEARGHGYAQARAVNPNIVWCAITGFGQDGPYTDHAGHDLSYLAHSGLLGALSPDLPWHPASTLALQAGANAAVIGIQAALMQVARGGEGSFVDISLSEATSWLLTAGIAPLSDKAYYLSPTPDRQLYACADGRYVAVASSEPRTWGALCDGLGVPDLKPVLHKWGDAAALTRQLADIFATRPAADWVAALAPAGAAVTIVNHGSQLLDDPHVVARGSVVEVAGTPVPASPIRLSGVAGRTATAAPPLVGQDSDAVLAAAGFSAEEIGGLAAAGLI
ncbi:CoA transferase [Sphingobium sufflavum]|uniref:CaiB/BaiF CoA transferase family protein n=1 Tax=Sphingobium sufflavum TaxID=1129547 RepID=UPI001F2ED5DA|nr:CaiB/BaiF CoA-transferase family protein [Sphingobium sufflavum]MCE7796594.1 CoA transferase [Sphingobium sufflavum]